MSEPKLPFFGCLGPLCTQDGVPIHHSGPRGGNLAPARRCAPKAKHRKNRVRANALSLDPSDTFYKHPGSPEGILGICFTVRSSFKIVF